MTAPRVIAVMPEQWPRALLRAALREEGYDAIGARTLREAVAYPRAEPGRGPVRLVIVDARGVNADASALLGVLHDAHEAARFLLIAAASRAAPPGPWDDVLRRPQSVDAIVAAVRRMLPLPPDAPRPLDA